MLLTALATGSVAAYAASTLLPVRGIHDWFYRQTLFSSGSDGIALTFDDGPHPEQTPALLDLLATADAKATFFVVGERAAQHPDIVRRIAGEGHAIGNHSWSHRWLPGLGSKKIEEELQRCQQVLGDILGQTPGLVRPPYGSRDFRFYRAASRLRMTPVLWSTDTRDWAGAGERHIFDNLRRARQGAIVLMHDGNPRAGASLPALRRWLAQRLSGEHQGMPPITLLPAQNFHTEGSH
jgi:peptidoglycan-N-acetylglucosamine deacetylase